jgi:hypothetical protein
MGAESADTKPRISVTVLREVLTVRDVTLELRCSMAHVYRVINGKVKNVAGLPTISIGRQKLVQRNTLELEEKQGTLRWLDSAGETRHR